VCREIYADYTTSVKSTLCPKGFSGNASLTECN
jgi:hypothetical protein